MNCAWKASAIPLVIATNNDKFQAMLPCSIIAAEHNSMNAVIVKNTPSILCRRLSLSPSTMRSIPGCDLIGCFFSSSNPPISRSEILVCIARQEYSVASDCGKIAINIGVVQIKTTDATLVDAL